MYLTSLPQTQFQQTIHLLLSLFQLVLHHSTRLTVQLQVRAHSHRPLVPQCSDRQVFPHFKQVAHHLCLQIPLLLLHHRCLAHQRRIIQIHSALSRHWLTLNRPHYFNLPQHLHNSHQVHQLSPLETYLAHHLAVCLAADLHFFQRQHFRHLPLFKLQTHSPSNLQLNQLLQVVSLVFPTLLIRPSLDNNLLASPIWSCSLLLFQIHLGHFQQCLRCPLGMADLLLQFNMEYQVCRLLRSLFRLEHCPWRFPGICHREG